MAEFLVRMEIQRPDGIDDSAWTAVLGNERAVALGYRRRGVIARMWRVPGTTGNVGVWNAADASELHSFLSGLPAFPYMKIAVEALALHYLEAGVE